MTAKIKNKLKTLFFLSVVSITLLKAQPLPEWSSSIGTNFPLYIYDDPQVKLGPNGEVIVGANIINGVNEKDFLLMKYDTAGSLIWVKTYNGPQSKDDKLRDFQIDNTGNVFVTGYSTIDSVNSDVVTLKYSTTGSLVWTNIYDGIMNRFDQGSSIALDQNGVTYVTGFTSIDTINHSRPIIHKIDPSGNTVWTHVYNSDSLAKTTGEKIRIVNGDIRVIGGCQYDGLTYKYVALALDTNGSIILSNMQPLITLTSRYYIDANGNSYISRGFGRFKITKIDSLTNIAWSDSILTNLPSNVVGDEVKAITVDSLGNVYITGRHYGDDYGGPTYSNADVLTVKYSSNGTQIWQTRYEYLGNDEAEIGNTITLDEDLNVYVGGNGQRTTAGTDYDYIVVKHDNAGNILGTIRFNDVADGEDVISSMIVATGGSIYVTGLTFDNPTSSYTTTQKYRSVSGLGLEDYLSESIILYPNPSTDFLFIDGLSNESYDCIIISADGRIVQKNKEINKVDIRDLQPGLYFISDEKGKWIKKFIKF